MGRQVHVRQKRVVEIELASSDVVAGKMIAGRITSNYVIRASSVRLEMRHTESKASNHWRSHSAAIPLPSGVLGPDQPLFFEFAVPEWLPPSFVGQTMSNIWLLSVLGTDSPHEIAHVPVQVFAAPAGTPAGDRESAGGEWRGMLKYWRSGGSGYDDGVPLREVLWRFAGGAATMAFAVQYSLVTGHGFMLGLGLGALAAPLSVVPAWGLWHRYRRTLELNELGPIDVSVVPEVVDAGERVVVRVASESTGPVTVSLLCREWFLKTSDESSSAVPTVVYEDHVVVQSSGVVEFQVPADALPSVWFYGSAVLWDVVVRHGDRPTFDLPANASLLVVIARASLA